MWELLSLEASIGDVFGLRFCLGNRVIEILADVRVDGRVAILSGVHFQGAGPNTIGGGQLKALAKWAKEALDVDELRVEGATRTTGANPGHAPSPLLFR
jgi:hypothetical protein